MQGALWLLQMAKASSEPAVTPKAPTSCYRETSTSPREQESLLQLFPHPFVFIALKAPAGLVGGPEERG